MEKKTFYFVHGLHADRASRRQMRRHVMKGKNTGKTFHRPSRLELQVAPRRLTMVDTTNLSYMRYASSNAVIRSFGNAFLTLSLPVKITPYSLQVIDEFFNLTADRIYPVQLGLSLHDIKLMWLKVLFEDEAIYHCNISLMEACNEIFLGDGDCSPKALHHLSQTFALVKKRLESDEALSDSTIAIVVSLINQEQIRQQGAAAEIHAKGLKRIVELRGGLGQLEGNLFLVLKICKTDILFALQHGGPTMFFRDRMPEVRNILASRGLRLDRTTSAASAPSIRHNRLDPYLDEILLDAMSVCSLLNNNLRNHRTLDLLIFQELLASLCYRLLRFRSLNMSRQECDVQSAPHIGLVIFMMTVFLQYDHRRIIDYRLISLCLRHVLDSGLDEHENELALWLMIVGGIWVSGDATDGDWLAPRIWIAAQRLGLDTWDDARSAVCEFPWINALHDEPGGKLWNQVRHGH